MPDQAWQLRAMTQGNVLDSSRHVAGQMRTIAVASGKGGVGKTSLVVNLGISLARLGQRVIIFDADMGLANVDIMMGVYARHNLFDVVKGEMGMEEVMVDGPCGIKIIPGASGVQELANMDYYQRERLIAGLNKIEAEADFLLIDTGAGISKNVLAFVAAAGEVIIVVTPEPTSITDGYSLIKILAQYHLQQRVGLVVNQARNRSEAEATVSKIQTVAGKFLKIEIGFLGSITDDKAVSQAVKEQKPFTMLYPRSEVALQVEAIAAALLGQRKTPPRGMGRFIQKMLRAWS